MTDGRYSVAVARFPNEDWECRESVGWLIKTVRAMDRDPRIAQVLSVMPPDKTPIPMLRNWAVQDALRQQADYLLMLDSDMVPDGFAERPFWDVAWDFLLARRSLKEDSEPPPCAIAAPYCGPPPDETVYIMQWQDRQTQSANPNFYLGPVSRLDASVRSGIQEVAALPTGLIVYDMRVFERLPHPHFAYEYTDETESERCTTEDVYQTRNQSLLGLPVYVAWDSWAGHRKTKIVGKPLYPTRDQVHKSLVQAIEAGLDSRKRLLFLAGSGRKSAAGAARAPAADDQIPDKYASNAPPPAGAARAPAATSPEGDPVPSYQERIKPVLDRYEPPTSIVNLSPWAEQLLKEILERGNSHPDHDRERDTGPAGDRPGLGSGEPHAPPLVGVRLEPAPGPGLPLRDRADDD